MNKKTWDLVVGIRPPVKRLCSSSAFPGFTSKMSLVSKKGEQEESQAAAAWRTPLGCRRGCEGGLSSREQSAGSPHRKPGPREASLALGSGFKKLSSLSRKPDTTLELSQGREKGLLRLPGFYLLTEPLHIPPFHFLPRVTWLRSGRVVRP